MDWSYIFVVILSVLLVVSLIVVGILLVMFIRLTRQIQHLSGSAQRTVRSFRTVIDRAGSSARALSVVAVALKKIRSVKRKKHHEAK